MHKKTTKNHKKSLKHSKKKLKNAQKTLKNTQKHLKIAPKSLKKRAKSPKIPQNPYFSPHKPAQAALQSRATAPDSPPDGTPFRSPAAVEIVGIWGNFINKMCRNGGVLYRNERKMKEK
jgi:hypothetical protein